MAKILFKDPDAVLDYGFDWTKWLNGDTISASSWTVPLGITKDSDSYTDVLTYVWLSGGTAGDSYDLVNSIETAGGRKEDKTLTIVVKEK